jgi:hypothetical protein
VSARTDIGETVYHAISGNVTSFQISKVTIAENQFANSTIMSFSLAGESDTIGFNNMTIPKNAIPYGTNPIILIDDQQASNQGYTQDSNNFYVWHTTHFDTHQVKVHFVMSSTSQVISFGSFLVFSITVPEIILIYAVLAIRRSKGKPEDT